MSAFALDPAHSSVRIRVFAKGLLATLARDLELRCSELAGQATRDDQDPVTGRGELVVPLRGIEVAGVLRGDRVDANGLSASERAEVLLKMRRQVFHASASAEVSVAIEVAAGVATLRIALPNGRVVARTVTLALVDAGNGGVLVRGALELSLAAIGASEVRGPFNAFRLKDQVAIAFEVLLVADGGSAGRR